MTSPAILSYGRPRRRLARVPLLFRARDCEDEDGIFALSYGKRVGLVHTRSGATGLATMADENGMLLRVPSDWPRLSWEMTNAGTRARVLLGENARTNLVARSQEFDDAGWIKGSAISVTANAAIAPDGTATMDLLTNDGSLTFMAVYRPVVFTGDGEKCVSVFLRAGSAAVTTIGLYDATALTMRHSARIDWNAGIPSLAHDSGTGTRYGPEWHYNDGWRIALSATGVIAANTNRFIIYPSGPTATAGTVYAWGAQAENAIAPSSYIRTAGTATARAADTSYLPLLTVPQAGTLYLKGVARHRFADTTARLLHLGSVVGTTAPSFSLASQALSNSVLAQYRDGGSNPTSSLTPSAAILRGDVVEMRGLVSDTWEAQIAASVNGADEVLGAASAAGVSSSAWSATRVYLTGGLTVNSGMFGYDSFVYDLGTHELDELRELVEVA